MSHSVAALPHQQTVVVTITEHMPAGDHLLEMDQAVHALLRTFDPQALIVLVFDLSGVKLAFSDVMLRLADIRQFNNVWYAHSLTLFVGQDAMVKLAAEAMQQEQYGSHPTAFFTTLEAALDHARAMHGAPVA